MKRITAILFCVVLIFTMSACGAGTQQSDGKISVVTTIFPVYDWVRNVARNVDDVDVSMLVDSGVDLHSFQPTVNDILKISTCDVFVYVGGESDKWVDSALKEATNKNLVAINLLDELGDNKREEELKEGMQSEEEEGEEEEETEYDEHIWLSLKNAKILCDAICEGLCKADKANSETYRANLKSYAEELDGLDKAYFEAVTSGSQSTLIFGDRFPFRYLTEDYNIDYYAAFIGCSAESEASFKTIKFLADKMDEYALTSIIKIEGSNGNIAKTVIENTKSKNAVILTLNSMQSITAKDVSNGVTYTDICKSNLEVLREALK